MPGFGISRSRDGSGEKLRSFSESRSAPRNSSTPRAWMEAAVWPSTPAVFAPLLPRTRSHADQQERGIGDEVEQVTEPAMRVIDGPAVQFGLDLQYPAPGHDRTAQLQLVGIHQRDSRHSSILPA